MQLEWINHPCQLVEGVSEIFNASELLDVTITAEGKKIRAHRVVLSAASTYFRDILTSEDIEKSPIIFMRDVTFFELQSLIQFIYSGRTIVPGSQVEDFLRLAKTLGIKGFSIEANKENEISSNLKERNGLQDRPTISTSSSSSPFKKSSASEPVNMPSHLLTSTTDSTSTFDDVSKTKKRRLQSSKSLDEVIISPPTTFKTSSTSTTFKTSKHLKTPSTPLSPLALPSFWTTAPVTLSSPGSTPVEVQKLMPPPLPPPPVRQAYQHSSHLSCPVDTLSPKTTSNNANNFSFDSSSTPFLDPQELAAKGATLLHHLALWMIEEKKSKEILEEDHLKMKSETLQTAGSGSSTSRLQNPLPGPSGISLHRHRGSECDRPDSGFDSKDEDETNKTLQTSSVSAAVVVRHVSEAISEESGGGVGGRSASEASSSSSPDNVKEISRQAPIRQPIFRKRRIHNQLN